MFIRAFFICLLFSLRAYASVDCLCWDCDTCCQQGILLWGKGLYLQPTSCANNFVIKDKTFKEREGENVILAPVGKESAHCPSYNMGFRVGIGYVFEGCTLDAMVSYSRLVSTHSVSRTAGDDEGLWPTAGSAPLMHLLKNGLLVNGPCEAKASDRIKIEWSAVDGEIGVRYVHQRFYLLRTHIGIHYLDLCSRRDTEYTGAVFEEDNIFASCFKSDQRTWAIGPRLGGGVRYDMGCGFGVNAKAGWGILAGIIRHEVKGDATLKDLEGELLEEIRQDVKSRDQCIVVPAFDISLGLDYLLCCDYTHSFLFELGWEFRSYLNSTLHSHYIDPKIKGETVRSCEAFNLQGLYFGVTFKF